jgi:hypothetical protein|tara:strand:- start:1434 stop:1691 length:258 start_codon:yes stop_codon:yes gene_type:complete
VLIPESVKIFFPSPKRNLLIWPLHCKGSLDASFKELCLPDRKAITRLVGDIAEKELKRKGKEKLIEKVPDKLKKPVEKLLKGLFD